MSQAERKGLSSEKEIQILPRLTARPKRLTCLICGGSSRCSYFGAVCCESCKVFFRRAVISGTLYQCTSGSNCHVSLETRRLCASCRFGKCLRVGMVPTWVTPRVTKAMTVGTSVQLSSSRPNDCRCGFHATQSDLDIVDNLLQITSETIRDIPFPEEVFVEQPTFTHIINVLSIVVKRMIAFTKTFADFKSLPMSDQLTLLKSASLEIMLTRKATTLLYKVSETHGMVWMVEKGRFLFSKTNLAHAYGETLYEKYMAYINTLMKLEVDDKSLIILTCICLFSPDREDISSDSSAFLDTVQRRYVTLLERYLHWNFQCEKAKVVYPKILVAQCWAREASHYYSQAAMQCSGSEIEPLMKEFFNME